MILPYKFDNKGATDEQLKLKIILSAAILITLVTVCIVRDYFMGVL